MHPDAPGGLRDSSDDHGDNVRPPGPVEEQGEQCAQETGRTSLCTTS